MKSAFFEKKLFAMIRLFTCLVLLTFSSGVIAQNPAPCPSLAEPSSDGCQAVCISCGLQTYTGTTVGYSGSFAPEFCGTIENEQWFAFVAGTAEGVLTATPSNCTNGDGIQIALYNNCAGGLIDCDMGGTGMGNTPVSISPTNLVVGQTYYLLIDGYAGDGCDFTLTINPAELTTPPPTSDSITPPSHDGPAVLCPGAVVEFSVPAVANAGYYTWSVPPGATIYGVPGPLTYAAPEGQTIVVQFGSSGGNVCVEAGNSCNPGTVTACRPVNVAPIPPTNLPPVVVCAEEAPYTLPWGQVANITGLYQIVLESYLGCDSVVRQNVTIKQPIVTNLGVIGACTPPACATVCDTVICGQGVYSIVCTSAAGCDSLIIFNLAVAEAVGIVAPVGQTITCDVPDVPLNAQGNNLVNIAWTDYQGQVLTNTPNLTVSSPGYYTFAAIQALGATNCPYSKTLLVKKNIQAPEGTATGGVISAQNPSVQLTASSVTFPVQYSWSGPGGFSSGLQNPVVGQAGEYTVTLTNPATGCSTAITVQVIQQ